MSSALPTELSRICYSRFGDWLWPLLASNSTRTKLFASLLNSRLGKPNSCNRFETYVNIVLSYNTVLPSHVDKKNDHCAGYDHCAVYTFATIFSGRVCRVTIIMTSHTVSESWLKNRLQLKKKLLIWTLSTVCLTILFYQCMTNNFPSIAGNV